MNYFYIYNLTTLRQRETFSYFSVCVDVLIFTSFYLASSGLMGLRVNPTKESIKCCANVEKSATETVAIIMQAFEEESMSRARRVQAYRDRKRRDK
jgi:hypothetical protein